MQQINFFFSDLHWMIFLKTNFNGKTSADNIPTSTVDIKKVQYNIELRSTVYKSQNFIELRNKYLISYTILWSNLNITNYNLQKTEFTHK